MSSARALIGAGLLVLLAACASTPVGDGQYRVERGDTLSRIASRHGQSVQDLVRWNRLSDPDEIHVGQVLRVAPAGASTTSTGTKPPPSSVSPDQRIKNAPAVADKAPGARIGLNWPADGKLARSFNGSSAKGITITNDAGTPVKAAAAGTVAYAGSGLRGYGNLIIIQHNPSFLTIYAHNRRLDVREGERVRQGQKIAEMGNSDSTRVQLYFELRYQGTPTNPARFLPPR